MKQVAIQDIN